MPKLINIYIPDECTIPNINSFTPEQNILMLNIGYQFVNETINKVIELSQEEVYNKVREETKEQLKQLEIDLLVEKGLMSKTSQLYENRITQLEIKLTNREEQINSLLEELNKFENSKDLLVQEEVKREQEKFKLILAEKDRQNALNREAFEKLEKTIILTQTKHKSTKEIGIEGEKYFNDLSDTFKDFNGFQLINKAAQAHQGDFHLFFDEFNVLVDMKKYNSKVPKSQIEKIKRDLLKNEHINFGWLISLNTDIDNWNRSPIMYEWINTNKCICYINNISQYENPSNLLRIVWFTCKELNEFAKDIITEENELKLLREKDFKTNDKIRNLRKTNSEMKSTIKNLLSISENIDSQLKDILQEQTTSMVNIIQDEFKQMDEWWNTNVEECDESVSLTSTELWFKFKKENKNYINENKIDTDKFKEYIRAKYPAYRYKEKTKNGAYEIIGIQMKEMKIQTEELEVEVELKSDELTKPKKKIIKSKKNNS
jgi:hypothetical protein